MTVILCKCCPALPFFNFESYLSALFFWLVREWNRRIRARNWLYFTRQPFQRALKLTSSCRTKARHKTRHKYQSFQNTGSLNKVRNTR